MQNSLTSNHTNYQLLQEMNTYINMIIFRMNFDFDFKIKYFEKPTDIENYKKDSSLFAQENYEYLKFNQPVIIPIKIGNYSPMGIGYASYDYYNISKGTAFNYKIDKNKMIPVVNWYNMITVYKKK